MSKIRNSTIALMAGSALLAGSAFAQVAADPATKGERPAAMAPAGGGGHMQGMQGMQGKHGKMKERMAGMHGAKMADGCHGASAPGKQEEHKHD